MTKQKIITIIFIVFLCIFSTTTKALGRAGGGQDYVQSESSSSNSDSSDSYSSSSNSSSNYSSSGSRSSGSSSPMSGVEAFGAILFGIFILVIFPYLKRTGKWDQLVNSIGSAKAAANSTTPAVDIIGEINKIKTSDPGFNEQLFKDKVQAAFFKIQEGWERQDTTVMRPYVSDSVLQRFSNQLADLKSRGEKNVLENIVIGHTDINNVSSDTSFNYITVKIDASCADYTVNSQNQMIKGSKTPSGFTEYWTFLRTIGVKTNLDKQLKDNKCPNCGGALEVNATGKCNYCGAIVTSGQFDWVLSEIRQV